MPEPIRFKFKHVDAKGNETGLLSKKGSFDGETITLARTVIPVTAVVRAQRLSNRLILTAVQKDGMPVHLALVITGGSARKLLSAINVSTAARWCEMRLEALTREGRQAEFRSLQCPHCQAMIDLTGRPESPQVACLYCDAISTHGGTPPPDEGKYSRCDACDFYAQPKEFTEFLVYFVLFMAGWSVKKYVICHSCQRSKAWKNFFGNFLFVIGLPVAAWQVLRAYLGGSARSQAFAGLDTANALAKRGKVEQASEIYNQIENRLGCCAGVRYNHGLAYVRLDQWDQAAQHFEQALADCSNYAPAYHALCACYEKLGRADDLRSLRAAWSEEEENVVLAQDDAGEGHTD